MDAVFQSDIINDAKEKGITMYQDITNGIGPYLYYLASKYKNFYQWDLNEFSFDVSVSRDEILVPLCNHRINSSPSIGVEIESKDIYDGQLLPIEGPFKICVVITADYVVFEQDEEDDDEYEDEIEPPPLTNSFKTDQCVICLRTEPNILCYDCMHICICLECEEVNPLNTCPYCRLVIKEKICI